MAQISEQRKAKIRDMREKGASVALIHAEVGVNSTTIKECCKDMDINQRCKNPLKAELLPVRDTLPVKTLKFDELSEEDKKRYNSYKPPARGEDSEAYVTGTKGRYCNANVFEASRRGRQRWEYQN